jgi:hypothetical protein
MWMAVVVWCELFYPPQYKRPFLSKTLDYHFDNQAFVI